MANKGLLGFPTKNVMILVPFTGWEVHPIGVAEKFHISLVFFSSWKAIFLLGGLWFKKYH